MKFQDSEFMTATEKHVVIRQWETFLRLGCKEKHFTKQLYSHLTLHCAFIAHHSRCGFYADYFETGDDRAEFLSQFDSRPHGDIPPSVEFGDVWWATRSDCADINSAMVETATPYIPALLEEGAAQQREADVTEARALLAKHGITLEV